MVNDFRPFGAAMAKLSTNSKTIEREDGAEVQLPTAVDKKHRRIDTSYEIYMALYQAITGPEERQKLFRELSPDFFDLIVIDERTKRVAAKVSDFLKESGDRFQKTIVFCVDTEHAARMLQALINENPDLVQRNECYVMRITGDAAEGCAQIGNFTDPEAKYPVIVTTSRLLSTGVDAQTCRLIVLQRTVGSMTEFKQIVGRGTRVHEDTKKYYFTLIDFRKATNHFADFDFDGEPVQIYEPGDDDPVVPPDDAPPVDDGEEPIPPEPGEILYDPACGTGGFLTCAIRHMRGRYVKTPADEQGMQQGLRATEKKQLPHMLCVTKMLLHGIDDPSFVRHDNTLARPYVSYGKADRVDIVLTNPPFGGREEDGIETNFPKHFQIRETADLFLALIVRLLKPEGRAAVVLPDGTLFGEGVKTRLVEHLLAECNLHTIVRLPNSVFKPYASIGMNLLFFEKGPQTKEVWFYEHRVPEGQKAYSMTRSIRFEHLQPCIDWWGGAKREGREGNDIAWKVTIDEIKARSYNLDFKNPHTVEENHGDPAVLLAKLEESEKETARLRDRLKAILEEVLLG